ncbi:hypothetical protein E1176_03625 [Fulvivirga sp. RKSG066]|uniref:hypothetical protein n=1 Tax=Fulvivirga aurantia TaxID=2529383 RepID=UPI001623EF73|nr:hypothetical protein [Fulvivirga aurantia]MTI20098.1 hypothetical protein [Fulvivirga aurantia]
MRLYLMLLFLLPTGDLLAQEEPTLFGLKYNHMFSGTDFNSGYGINLEGRFGEFSINYAVLYNQLSSDTYYLYAGGGQAASIYFFRKAIEEREALGIPLGIFCFLLPESVSFRIPISKPLEVGFYVAPYGFEFTKNRASEEEAFDISLEMGCRVYFQVGSWLYLMPQVGVKNLYGEDTIAVSSGFSIFVRTIK